jgi:hypothetical protein
VSNKIANPIKNSIPEIGKKNAPIIANNFGDAIRILVSKINNCIFIFSSNIVVLIRALKKRIKQPRQISKTKRFRKTSQGNTNKQTQKTIKTKLVNVP